MPVHGRGFGKLVVDDNANAIAFNGFDHGAGHGAVVTPEVIPLIGKHLAANVLGDEMKLFDAVFL